MTGLENPSRQFERPHSDGELVADALIHAIAILAGIVGIAILFMLVVMRGSVAEGLAVSVYAAGFFAMFGFSVAYNMAPQSPLKRLLLRFDYSSIYLMIAGTYTPLLSQLQHRTWAWALLIVVWVGAIVGIAVKLALPGRFDRLSTVAYLALGWVGAIAAKPLIDSLPSATVVLIVAGGVLYSAGIIFHLWHSLKFQKAIWHAFVAAAAACHYAAIVGCVA